MKKASNLLLALTFILVTSARAADEKPVETPWYPLKVGNTWTYKAGTITMTTKVVKYEEFEKQLSAHKA